LSAREVTVASFAMAKYETTYELWYEVRVWAAAHGYTFVNQGREGHDGTNGAAVIRSAADSNGGRPNLGFRLLRPSL
jgi:formylglycine-generating enzyme required for sulfatase activity